MPDPSFDDDATDWAPTPLASILANALRGAASIPRGIADTNKAAVNAVGLPPGVATAANAINPITAFGQFMPSGQQLDRSIFNGPYPVAPSRRDVANTLGAPVDSVSYLLHRLTGLNVPTTTPSSSTYTYQPAANVPFSSEFFNNLLGDAGALPARSSQYFQNLMNDPPSINALAQTMRRRF